MKIVCIGQSAYDITLPIDGYPEENKKYKIKDKCECGGGSSNNVSYLLGMWGMNPTLVSSIGNDLYGKRIKEEQQSVNVDITYIEEIDGVETTTSYIINNRQNGSRTIITNKSELMHRTNNNIKIDADIIFLDGNEEEIAKKIIEDNPHAIKIIDAGGYRDSTVRLAKLCDYIVCSNDFAKDYSKIDFKYQEKEKIVEAYNIIEKDFNGKLIITLEAFGSVSKVNNEFYFIPSIKVKNVDSTGAGDIYHGAFTYFIANNYSLLETIYYSNIAGALSVTKLGSKHSIPTLNEVINYHEL